MHRSLRLGRCRKNLPLVRPISDDTQVLQLGFEVNRQSCLLPVVRIVQDVWGGRFVSVSRFLVMALRRFELNDGSTNKFWQIDQRGQLYSVQYGRVGTNGQTIWKSFDNEAAAEKAAATQIKKKNDKGYKEVKVVRKRTQKSGRITPPPSMDVTTIIPEVSGHTAITVRLHPQQGEVADIGASKVGGQILWPENEAWPTCLHAEHLDDQRPVLVPVLQLRKEDVPELPFPPKTNLFQLLWCPNKWEHDEVRCNPLPRIFWRNSERVKKPIGNPPPNIFEEDCVPKPCTVTPERVVEFPDTDFLFETGILGRLEEEHGEEFCSMYQFELSTCPSMKVGGYPNWVQDGSPTYCPKGHEMEFLLQLGDSEYANTQDHPRWIPEEDRWILKSKSHKKTGPVYGPPQFAFGHSVFYFFVCRECSDLPLKMEVQR